MNRLVYIYTLSHPVTGVIRYVGKTVNLDARLREHLRAKDKTKKANWVRSLTDNNLKPNIEILDTVAESDWQFWEVYWIQQLKSWGLTLYNGDNGGLGSDRLPRHVKDKISISLTGKPCRSKWVKYAQYSLQGGYIKTFNSLTEIEQVFGTNCRPNIIKAAKSKLSALGYMWVRLGDIVPLIKIETQFDENGKLTISYETRLKLSNASIGRRLGCKHSDESKAKQRLARLGVTPANKGIPMLDAQKNTLRNISKNKKKIKKLYLIQKGYRSKTLSQMEILANNYNGDTDAMSRQHGTYEMLEKEAENMPQITIEEVLSNEEVEISCFNCGD